MKSNRIIRYILAILFIASSLSFSFLAYADDISYSYNSDTNTLTLTGSGDMEEYSENYLPPWHRYAATCENIVMDEDITSISSYAFADFESVSALTLPDGIASVGLGAFARCTSLDYLFIPKSVTSIADSSFAYDDSVLKSGFVLHSDPGSYALHFAKQNNIPFDMDNILCGATPVSIDVRGMRAYYKYIAKADGTFRVYSSGNHDTYGAVYDSSFNLIKSNDDISDSNTNFSVNVDFVKGNTYYIRTNLISSGLTGTYNLRIAPVSYQLYISIYAMLNKAGDATNLLITDALVDGSPCNGTFTIDSTETTVTKTVTYNGVVKNFTFTPDSDDYITIMTVDADNDGYVNAKDYAILRNNSSPYLPLYGNFISY